MVIIYGGQDTGLEEKSRSNENMLQFLLAISDQSDHEKVEYIYHKYRHDMLRLAKYRLLQLNSANAELDAEDVVQNAFVKIVRHIGKIDFTLQEQSIRSYIMRIVVNEATTLRTDTIYCENLELYEAVLSDKDFIEQTRIAERYNDVVNAIEELDERYSIALSLRYIEQMSIKDISKLLGIEEKSVYTRIERGKVRLLEKLEEKQQ